jgi:cytochrome c biogenesis protein CcdA
VEIWAAPAGPGLDLGLLATVFVYGLRHGLDVDHIAAIADITASQDSSRRSLGLSSLYVVGHAFVVMLLGVAAITAGQTLPASVDGAMERVVGVSLLLLGLYVLHSVMRRDRAVRLRSRWMMLFELVRRSYRRARTKPEVVRIEHEHPHAQRAKQPASPHPGELLAESATVSTRHVHEAELPDDPFMNYGHVSSFAIGMLHGIGAETPTQVLVFLAAAGVGGEVAGGALLVAFLLGLAAMNLAVALAAAWGFLRPGGESPVYFAIAVVTGAISIIVGLSYTMGLEQVVP